MQSQTTERPFNLLDSIANRLRGVKWNMSDRDAVALAREILEGQHGTCPDASNWLAVTDAVASKEGYGNA